jgi:phosphopantetheine--protein transferase-like protein
MKKTVDIAIVGMSCYFPGANNIKEFWNNLVKGISSITDVPADRIDPRYFSDTDDKEIDRFYFHKGGFVNPIRIDPTQYGILPIAAQGLDPEHLLSLYLVKEALNDAGVYEKKIPLNNCSFVLGKGNYGGIAALRSADILHVAAVIENITSYLFPGLSKEEIEKIKKDYQARQGRYQADTASGVMPNMVVSLVANKLDLKGPAYTIDAACASSLLAVEHSINLLLSGQCDLALAGGMHMTQNSVFWSVFNVLGAASHKQQIAPFSEDADGVLIGEGAGIVVLKKLEKAIADNDRIYAVIKGCSSGSDGSDVSVMAPSSKGQVATLRLAWEKSGMDPKKIGYLETHGTATQVGDRVEIATLLEFFGDKSAPPALLGSVKSNIGHAMPAAGIAGLIKTVLALYHKKIPPTLHCKNPIKSMYETRFLPVQQLTDWDEEKYPLVAGVNAFGFGGINTHVILEPYIDFAGKGRIKGKEILRKDQVITLSAASQEALLKKLDKGDYSVSEGNYRLVIFNPTVEKIDKAKSLIKKDKPWKGRFDIWFSNQPLLGKGGKVVFMFTGFDPGTPIEVQTVSDYFEIPYKQVVVGKDKLWGHSINHHYRSQLLDASLKKMGLIPDINIGHSMGEWHAVEASGFVTSESIEKMLSHYYNPEESMDIDVFYIAVGCGYERIKAWSETIPNLYLANDNCTNQIVMAGKKVAVDLLIERLQKEQIYHQILPFQSGYHTPLISQKLLDILSQMPEETLSFSERCIPVWSATILEPYPTTVKEYYELSLRHFLETVRFRELIEKLYEQENARVFVQINIGSLCAFVEDTLKDKPISMISSVHVSHSGIEQFRRIAALLFIEGRTVNKELLGITEAMAANTDERKIKLDFNNKFTLEFPVLKEAMDNYLQKTEVVFSKLSSFSIEESNSPVFREITGNLREIATIQENILNWYQLNISGRMVKEKLVAEKQPSVVQEKTNTTIEKTLRFTLEDHPYLLDHVVVRQPKNWPLEDLNPVVPFAMTIETFCESAIELIPGKKALRISSAGVMKWIPVCTPFVEKMTGKWKTENCISWSLPGRAYGDVTLGDSYPTVPEEYLKEINLGNEALIPQIPIKEKIYNYFLFHGPQYQSIINVLRITRKGLRAHIRKAEGKGSMLDNLGQLLGLYCHLAFDKNQMTFPISVNEILFFQDIRDQEGVFEYTMVVNEIKDNEVISNVVIKRNGKVWCVVNGWHNRRFDYGRNSMNVIMAPHKFILAEHLNDNVFYFYNAKKTVSIVEFLYERYLNSKERAHYNSLYLNQARDYLISRIVLKDAVREYVQKDEEADLIFPIEISVEYNKQGKPYVCGHAELQGVEISLAHKDGESVVIVSDKPVGIDLEKIEVRTKEFMDIAFTPHELSLLKMQENETEKITRFWVAKEAYSKMIGTGLQGNPKQYEIESVNGNDLKIRDTVIKTVKHRNDYIVGWTL